MLELSLYLQHTCPRILKSKPKKPHKLHQLLGANETSLRSRTRRQLKQNTGWWRSGAGGGWSQCLCKWSSHRSCVARVLSIASGQFQRHIRGIDSWCWHRKTFSWVVVLASIAFTIVRLLQCPWPIIKEMPQDMAIWFAIPIHMITVSRQALAVTLGHSGTTEKSKQLSVCLDYS